MFELISRWKTSSIIRKNWRWLSGLAILGVPSFALRNQIVHAASSAATWLGIGLATFLALCFLFVVLPNILVRAKDIGTGELLKLRNDVRVAGIQILGGAVVLGGLAFTYQTLQLNRQGQITERFTQATNQLGNEQLDVRLGGIYALARIAGDSRDDAQPILAILTAYLRHHAHWSESPTRLPASAGAERRSPAADIQAVANVLRRPGVSDHAECLDLSSVDLGGVDLSRLSLVGANLAGSNLAYAKLERTDLSGASLTGADLTGAKALNITLTKADLTDAKLINTQLNQANLVDAFLTNAKLMKTILVHASLERADLRGAVLSDAELTATNLDSADLRGADLSTAIGLSQADIESAVTNKQTKIGAGLTMPQPREPFPAPPSLPCALR